jgi:methionine sulfoxide reductase heme-binding subunit
MRLSARTLAILGALLGLIVVASTDQVVPAATPYQAQMRIWLVARASGITAYLVLTFVVAIGLILSHPINKSTWKLSKQLFPWHENLFIFVVAFLVAHIVSIVLDPYAGVGIAGSFVPGLSSFRSVPVALGTLGLYALLITGLTARYTKLLPAGTWLKIHRLSIVVWALAWGHGILAGTDSGALGPLYVVTGLGILAAAAYRYWVGKQARPTFASSLPDGSAASRHRREAPAATTRPGANGPVEEGAR